ncbi:PIN domain-containing protein [Methylomonas sp. AM2-LC]|uniref:PIN domain-containing protein n=1 Tax=Methylomonas sp. AM2-LC TaxID=3153301 RepID=UPI003262F60D
MTSFSVVYDACVLYPAPLRDLLMHLALTDLYRAKWTEQIHEEWIRNLLEARPELTREQLERTRQFMDSSVRDCLVSGHEFLIPTLQLPDHNDRHVLAAAIRSHASVILTFNLKDFPARELEKYDVEALHPDEFISDLIDLNPAKVLEAVARHRRSLKNPPKTGKEYLDTLLQQGLPETVSQLRHWEIAF